MIRALALIGFDCTREYWELRPKIAKVSIGANRKELFQAFPARLTISFAARSVVTSLLEGRNSMATVLR